MSRPPTTDPSPIDPSPIDPSPIDRALAEEAAELAERWVRESAAVRQNAAARRLAGVLGDAGGLSFTVGFVDGVVRPEDVRVAARNLRELTAGVPRFLPRPLRALVQVGAFLAPFAPWLVIPAARWMLRGLVRHLVVDASDRRLGRAIARIRRSDPGVRLNVNLLGESILGRQEAARRLASTERLIERDDVDYISIKVSASTAPHSPWAFDEAVEDAVQALTPLLRSAALSASGAKFVNLDMEEYRDLDLTLAVFTRLLDSDELLSFEAGIVLQAYLPDALAAMMRLQRWARARRARGGAPVKVRVVKGANLPMERVDAELHGWPLATWATKRATDASYKALLDYALRAEHVDAVRVGVAGHNLFDIALAWLLAQRRGVTGAVEFEMLLGMAAAQASVVRRAVGSLLLYTPVVHPEEFDFAIAYLVRRLEESASQENFVSAAFGMAADARLFERERERFLTSVAGIPSGAPAPNRIQDRGLPQPPARRDGFENTADTDPAVAANRAWVGAIQRRMTSSTLGAETVARNTVSDPATLYDRIERAVSAGASWRGLGAGARAEMLHRAGDQLAARRGELLEVMGSECGKVVEQGDPEVSEVVDFAHYYAERGRELERVPGAAFTPARLTVVTPPWNFPVAIPGGSVLAALASGSPVLIKPAAQAGRCAAVVAEALWEAGVPHEVLQYVALDEQTLGRELISHAQVERVILTGGYDTAELFRSFRPDLELVGETSGKNAIVVTPSADLDLAARDVAYSAFGHAGQKCSAASLVILVGSAAGSGRFRRQLIDAVSSYRVGPPWEPASQIGPLIAAPEGKLLHALTTLEPGERWILEPGPLDRERALWTPGIKEGVRRGSPFHLTEYFGPVLGIMTAGSLSAAVGLVNEIPYGLTSGLQSLDRDEISFWTDRVEAGNLYVNRHITGAIVQRQPFGGWKRASVGPGAKTGGPNYLIALGSWRDTPGAGQPPVRLGAVAPPQPRDQIAARALAAAAGAAAAAAAAAGAAADAAADAGAGAAAAAAEAADLSWLTAALASDAQAWADEFGVTRDASGLAAERNLLRYLPVPVTVRGESFSHAELVRIVAAGVRAGSEITVSVAQPVPPSLECYFADAGISAHVEDERLWERRARELAGQGARVRLIGGSRATLAAAVSGAPALAIYGGEVIRAGRVELLTFLHEQAVSVTAHRFGTPLA